MPYEFQCPKLLHQRSPGTVDKDLLREQKARATSIVSVKVNEALFAMTVASIRRGCEAECKQSTLHNNQLFTTYRHAYVHFKYNPLSSQELC